MVICIIYLAIGLYLGIRMVNNVESEYAENGYYFAGLVISGYIWPITIIIGLIEIIKNKKSKESLGFLFCLFRVKNISYNENKYRKVETQMKNVKQIWEDNKKKIVVVTTVGVAAASVLLTKKYYTANFHLIPKACVAISWRPTGKFINLETAKAALDANMSNKSSFAIVKDVDKYIGIRLSGGVIVP